MVVLFASLLWLAFWFTLWMVLPFAVDDPSNAELRALELQR